MTTVFVFEPHPQMLIDLLKKRPFWDFIALSHQPLDVNIPANSWAFFEWDADGIFALNLCRMLRQRDKTETLNLNVALSAEAFAQYSSYLQTIGIGVLRGPLDAQRIIDQIESAPGFEASGPIRFTLGALTVDVPAHLVRVDKMPVQLAPTEFKILVYFLQNRGRVIPRSEFIGALGRSQGNMNERTIDIWVNRLRRLMSFNGARLPIRAVRKQGYVLDQDV